MKKITTYNRKSIAILFCLIFGVNYSVLSQCAEDRHTTNIMDGWMSCNSTLNPHAVMGESHWIHYDLGFDYNIHAVKIWNLSHPSFIKSGIKEAVFSSSMDGINWTTIDTFTISKAYYSGKYAGQLSIDLKGISARHVIITALSNHGGACVGFSEIRIHTQDVSQNSLALDIKACENGGEYRNIYPGVLPGGVFVGPGVTDNGDGSFNFDPDVVGPGTYAIQYRNGPTVLEDRVSVWPCGHIECPDCDNCGGYDQAMIDSPDIPTGKYIDAQVMAAGQVQAGRDVDFRGIDEIELHPGFEVKDEAEFIAQFRECYANGLQNSSFENDWSSWYYANRDSDSYTVNFSINSSDPYEGQQCAQIEVVDFNPSAWRVELGQEDVMLEENKTYRVILRSKSVDAESYYLRIQQSASPNTVFYSEKVAHSPYWEDHVIEFSTDPGISGLTYVEVWVGSSPGTHLFDNIKIFEVD